jgi:hypothetical protein
MSFCVVVPVVPVDCEVTTVDRLVASSATAVSNGLAANGPSNSATNACHVP